MLRSTLLRGQRLLWNRSVSSFGVIGLGHMGSEMVKNFVADGIESIAIYDKSEDAVKKLVNDSATAKHVTAVSSVEEMAKHCDVIVSMLPNDAALRSVSSILLEHSRRDSIHISCSTVSPATSRDLLTSFAAQGKHFAAAPVFARPDGLGRRQAIWMIAGHDIATTAAVKLLGTMGKINQFGGDAGAANVVKLCGNFMIASSIEAIAEASLLAEKNGVNREDVISLLTSTIFDCLIYKGYGQRVSQRDHRPGGFALELGLKDVNLVRETAKAVDAPMPFLSSLIDNFTSAKAKGRGHLDWSALGLTVAENGGIDISKDLARNEEAFKTE